MERADGFALHGEYKGHRRLSPLLSAFVDDCIERARDYQDRGARYSVRAPHPGGVPDAANALHVIKTLVYEDGELTLPEFVEILRMDFEFHERIDF